MTKHLVVAVEFLGLEPMGFHPLFSKVAQVCQFSVYIAISGVTVKSTSAHDILIKNVSEVVPINCSYRYSLTFHFS